MAAADERMRAAIALSAAVRFSGPALAMAAEALRALSPMASMVPARAAVDVERGVAIVMPGLISVGARWGKRQALMRARVWRGTRSTRAPLALVSIAQPPAGRRP